MGFDRVQLKQSAKQAMRGQRPHPMLITLLFSILVSIGSQIVDRMLGAASGSSAMGAAYAQAVLRYEDPVSAIQYVMLSFGPERLTLALLVGVFISSLVTSLWSGFMRVGYANFCLGMARRQQPQTGALFSHFPQWAGVLLTKFLEGVFRTLWELLLVAGYIVLVVVAAVIDAPVFTMLVMLIASVALALGTMWITLRYAMVDFLVADQGLTGMDAIRESKRLVRENGNTGRLFVLELSFIGWYLLEIGVVVVISLIAFISLGMGIDAIPNLADATAWAVGGVLGYLGLLVLALIVIGIFNLWLTPYITGAEALFYDWARGGNAPPAGGFGGGQGGWCQSYPPQQPTGYTRSSGPSSGTGIGPGSQDGGGAPRSPKPPRDDPWN